MGEGTGGYSGFTYERIPDEVNGYSITLQYQNQLWKGFVSMAHEVSRSFERNREDRSYCLGRGNYRSCWTSGRVGIKDNCCACLLQCRQPRGKLLG